MIRPLLRSFARVKTRDITRGSATDFKLPRKPNFSMFRDLHQARRGLWDASDAELLEAVWQFRRDFEDATIRANQHEV